MKEHMWENQFRTTTICVDSYDDGVLSGRVYHPLREDGAAFRSLSQFLLTMEALLDDMGFPQSYQETRNFAPAKKTAENSTAPAKLPRGARMTFQIQILFRQHASWQGMITWVEEGREESFRSVLELVYLLDSALRGEVVA